MFAHSDDSGGNSYSAHVLAMIRAQTFYEIFMKFLNHMMSIKKCVIGYVYFEITSILYLGRILMPLIIKFLSKVNIKPTDEGFSSDVKQSMSFCITLMNNGATLQQAYVGMKVYNDMVDKFYKIDRYFMLKSIRSDLPEECLGKPDPHPA